MEDLTRRDVIKLGAAATLTASLAATEALAQTPGPAAPAFFTKDEFALVDELSETIIPADDHSPGARAAGVAAYIDSRLAEAWEAKEKTQWRDGLALVDKLSRQANGKSFVESTPDQRVAVLTQMSKNEARPQKPEEQFFVELKSKVVRAYYTSKIGLRDDIEYKGNGPHAEFSGIDVSQESR